MDINERDFRRLDLNLLVVFHALLKERSVTRAAQRLFLGQPAVSGALKRLRQVFGDELFVRSSQGMAPTPRALELGLVIQPLLGTLQGALSAQPAFDPAASDRVFRIGLSDSLEVALMPELMQRLALAAPKVRIVSHATDSERAAGRLDAGDVELAIGVPRPRPAWQKAAKLFDWTFVCIYDPLLVTTRARRISLAEYLRHPHVITSFSGGLTAFVDDRLRELGKERRVVFSSPHFATSPLIVKQMPAITTVPTFIAAIWRDALGLAMSPLPIDVPSHDVAMSWTAANDADSGLQWLVGAIGATFGGRRWDGA